MYRRDDSLDVRSFIHFVYNVCRSVDAILHSLSGPVAYKQPLLYNLAVTREVIKQIYIRESLQPPNLSAIRTAYASLWSEITTPGLVRNLIQRAEVGRLCVYGLQAYGIFKVRFHILFCNTLNTKLPCFQIGEVLGRRSLVGYDLH